MVFQHLDEFYPEGVAIFKQMMNKHNISLPTGICAHLTEAEFDKMIHIALGMEPLWENALGENWKSVITSEKLKSIYKKI